MRVYVISEVLPFRLKSLGVVVASDYKTAEEYALNHWRWKALQIDPWEGVSPKIRVRVLKADMFSVVKDTCHPFSIDERLIPGEPKRLYSKVRENAYWRRLLRARII